MKNNQIGLVLSGGGAKGAYQVGVMKALEQLGIEVHALAGASIGALNGAIIASAPSQSVAVSHLENIWLQLAKSSPITLNKGALKYPAYLAVLGAFGLSSPVLASMARGLAGVGAMAKMIGMPEPIRNVFKQVQFWQQDADANDGLLCDHTLKSLVDQYLGLSGLTDRVPMYVSVYPTQTVMVDFARIVTAAMGIGDTQASHFYHVQTMPVAVQKKLLMASAALPLLYGAQEIEGQLYTDGGQGGWRDIQGNTPIAPLVEAGYQNIIVTHLNDGSVWDRKRYPGVNIIEIRPKTGRIARAGAVADVLGFDQEKIPSWIAQGYDDTLACIEPIAGMAQNFDALHASGKLRDDAVSYSQQSFMIEAMRLLDDA